MSKPYTGGCACGAVRYEIADEAVFSNECQCRDCQRRAGTGHGSYMAFPNKAFVTVTGKTNSWAVAGDSGHMKSHVFCPTCGAPVYLTTAAAPGFVIIHAGSLDEPARYKPQAVTYHSRGHAWDHLDPALVKFDKMPTQG